MDDARKEGKSAPFVCFCLVISYPAMRGDAMRTPNTHEPAFLFLSCLLNEIMGLHKNLSGSCAAILYVVHVLGSHPGCWAFLTCSWALPCSGSCILKLHILLLLGVQFSQLNQRIQRAYFSQIQLLVGENQGNQLLFNHPCPVVNVPSLCLQE